jgi:uncharacterized protein
MGNVGLARVEKIIARLGLQPHPERGFYVETYRAPTSVRASAYTGPRAASTAIYFLTTAEQPVTHLHRLSSDELFHLYEGGPLEIVRLCADGSADVAELGLDLAAGQRPQIAISAGTWFGTVLRAGASHCLVGCTVAPGFEFADFELADSACQADLTRRFPAMASRIANMSRART